MDTCALTGADTARLRSCDGSTRLSCDLEHDVLAFPLRHVLHDGFKRLLELGIVVDLFHEPIADALLSLEFLHFVQDDGAFESLARHSLDIAPVFRVLPNVGIDLGVDFGIDSILGLVATCIGVAGSGGGGSWFAHRCWLLCECWMVW
jgi:hypothetical protein